MRSTIRRARARFLRKKGSRAPLNRVSFFFCSFFLPQFSFLSLSFFSSPGISIRGRYSSSSLFPEELLKSMIMNRRSKLCNLSRRNRADVARTVSQRRTRKSLLVFFYENQHSEVPPEQLRNEVKIARHGENGASDGRYSRRVWRVPELSSIDH